MAIKRILKKAMTNTINPFDAANCLIKIAASRQPVAGSYG